MKTFHLRMTVLIVLLTSIRGDYDCVCNYAAEKAVYPALDVTSQPVGYLYEFDCKPGINEADNESDFLGIQFEHQIGYVVTSQDVRVQTCQGVPPDTDLIQTTLTKGTLTIPITKATYSTTKPDTTSIFPTTKHLARTITSSTKPKTRLITFTTKGTTYSKIFTTSKATTVTTTTSSTTTSTTSRTTTKSTTTTTRPTTPVPVTWPIGTYGLMQSAHGCPTGTRWLTGWRKQDTEDHHSHNYFTAGIQNFLGGDFHSNNLVTKFCIKYTSVTSSYDKPWPAGSYCILKHKSCPSGFRSGFLYWDDEDDSNKNSRGGTLPDGAYDRNTRIDYCCRNDGHSNSEIILPTERPFILLRFGNVCQAVRDMNVRDVYVRWDDEDTRNESGNGGWHPADEGGSGNHLLHFCYYYSRTGPSLIG